MLRVLHIPKFVIGIVTVASFLRFADSLCRAGESGLDPTAAYYPTGSFGAWALVGATVVSVVLFGVTVWYLVWQYDKSPKFLPVLIFVWTLGPPIWFWMEYFWIYRTIGRPGTFEQFKYAQSTAGAIWAGLLAFLIALAAERRLHSPSSHYLTSQHALTQLEATVLDIVKPTGASTAQVALLMGLNSDLVELLLRRLQERKIVRNESGKWVVEM